MIAAVPDTATLLRSGGKMRGFSATRWRIISCVCIKPRLGLLQRKGILGVKNAGTHPASPGQVEFLGLSDVHGNCPSAFPARLRRYKGLVQRYPGRLLTALIFARVSTLATNTQLTVTNLNDFNGPHQTTNLGVRSSNLFGRAIYLQKLFLTPNALTRVYRSVPTRRVRDESLFSRPPSKGMMSRGAKNLCQ
jgi:hypothetical protein